MFILGLLAGPALGLLGGDVLRRSSGPGVQSLVLLLVAVGVLFAPAIALELKAGLLFGLSLGYLLSGTPYPPSVTDLTSR